MKYYPLFYKLEDKRCLVVGGGQIALRRAKSLLPAGAVIDLIAPDIIDELKALVVTSGGVVTEAEFDAERIANNYVVVVAATNSRTVNERVEDYARQHSVLFNRVDLPGRCDFIFPSIIDRSPLTIAISNSGSSPVLLSILKQQLSQFVPNAYGELSSFVGENRSRVKEILPDILQRSSFWHAVLKGTIAEAFLAGKKQEASILLNDALKSPVHFMAQGEVYLIGAGPGDPDLLTLKAFRLIQLAEVVLYDRLVSDDIMALVNKQAELVYVGKRRDKHAVPQQDINQLLIDYAKKGKRVARLKGGDPFIFGRGGEEIETLADEGVAFQVVPGITAASGCSSYAGIPLTHRDYAQSVQFITGQLKDGTVNLNWQELIAPGKTLVFYMGLKGLPIICHELIKNGMKADMPCALVEKGTTSQQRVIVSTLLELPDELLANKVSSPSLFIVGDVVRLTEKLNWFNDDK
jgi:uroporphyrin-III C-methyltransferase/precorrin-2 dehydrogenase/sirohydrochlorin ferrochelatase